VTHCVGGSVGCRDAARVFAEFSAEFEGESASGGGSSRPGVKKAGGFVRASGAISPFLYHSRHLRVIRLQPLTDLACCREDRRRRICSESVRAFASLAGSGASAFKVRQIFVLVEHL
jgi:hypothetical protein